MGAAMFTEAAVTPGHPPAEADPATQDAPAPRSLALPLVVLGLAGAAATVACVVALLAGGGSPVGAPRGLPDAGLGVGWARRGAGLLVNLAAVMTVGSLLVGAVLVQPPGDGRLDLTGRRAVRSASRWALGWAALSAVLVVLTVAETGGVRLGDLSSELLRRAAVTQPAVVPVATAAAALLVTLTASRVTTVRGARAALALALLALVPAATAGHSATAPDQDVAAAGVLVHVAAAALWAGGVAGLFWHLRSAPVTTLSTAVRRFSGLALAAYLALAVSGLLVATTRLGVTPARWESSYGALVAAKVALLVVLGLLGYTHRRRTIAALAHGRRVGFLRVAGVELLLMGAAMGTAAALASTPPPAAPVPTHGTGHSSLPSAVDPVSFTQLATAWRVNALVVLALAVAVGAYVAGVRVLARHGQPWPVARSVAFAAAVMVAAVDLCSGVATYATAMVSVQIAQLLVALLLVPALVALGAPVTLRRAVLDLRGADDLPTVPDRAAARALVSPVAGAVATCVLLVGVYRTPMIELSLRSPWAHLFVLGLAVVAGLCLFCPLVEAGRPSTAASAGSRLGALGAVAGCLGILAAQLGFGDRLLAGSWFLELRWGWVDPATDQRLGGAIIAVAAVALLLAAAALPTRPDGPATPR